MENCQQQKKGGEEGGRFYFTVLQRGRGGGSYLLQFTGSQPVGQTLKSGSQEDSRQKKYHLAPINSGGVGP